MLIAGLSALAACSESIGSVEPPKLTPPPEEITVRCDRPGALPERPLTQSEVEAYWIRDRERLVQCGYRFDALLAYYTDRDSRIAGDD